MAQYFSIHPDNPQGRLISRAAVILRRGGVIVYPTDSCYALGCLAGDKLAFDRIMQIRRLDARHNMTLICRDMSEIGSFARLDNTDFRFIKSLTPGPYTFLLKATRDVPRRLQHPQRKTLGLRIPDNRITLALLESLGEPIMSTSLIMPGAEIPETDPQRVAEILAGQVDLIMDGGAGGLEPTTVIDLASEPSVLIRQGKGEVNNLVELD